jgi:hypothetical protein
MVRPKKFIRFTRVCVSRNYWVVYDNGRLMGHVPVGSNWNFYYCNTKRIVIRENFPNMQAAYQSFISLWCINNEFKMVLS